MSLESSETPTRSYIINYEKERDFRDKIARITDDKIDEIIDTVLDGVLES